MAEQSWFFASQGQQQGPYPEAQLRHFIASGAVTADTLVWTEGMANWQKAGEIPGLLADNFRPPGLPHAGTYAAGGDQTSRALAFEGGTWALFGRLLLYLISVLLVIPVPWVVTALYRWFVAHLHVPQRPYLTFTGKPGDIWYVFVILALATYVGLLHIPYLSYLLVPAEAVLAWVIIRWFVANLSPDGRQHPWTFTGSVWGYIGWYILTLLSFITIIGWAWVLTAWMRWTCRNIAGARRTPVFNASGLQALWRTLAFVLAAAFIIPIPWVLAWYARWYVSRFALVEPAA